MSRAKKLFEDAQNDILSAMAHLHNNEAACRSITNDPDSLKEFRKIANDLYGLVEVCVLDAKGA